jgi:GT2 family glycosyltransferase
MSYQLSCSIVLYNTAEEVLKAAVDSVLQSDMKVKLFLIDNSPVERYNETFGRLPDVTYIFNNANVGYGAAHNIGIRKSIEEGIPYHLVLNPDVEFGPQVLSTLFRFMDVRPGVGLVMPQIRFPDGSLQYLCKMMPTPFDLIVRRFIPAALQKPLQARMDRYEFRHKDYNKVMDVPNLSGCFMFMRTAALKEVGGFDEGYFMYLEDVDLVRRIGEKYSTMYNPEVFVCHAYAKESYKGTKLMRYHIRSAFYYFNKWGWFFDGRRRRINRLCR